MQWKGGDNEEMKKPTFLAKRSQIAVGKEGTERMYHEKKTGGRGG